MSDAIMRQPDRCQIHTDSGLSATRRWEPNPSAGPEARNALVQHRCPEGCGSQLGWYYQGPRGEIRHGPGACRDEEVLLRIRTGQHDMETIQLAGLTLIPVIISAFFLFLAAAYVFGETWTSTHTMLGIGWGIASTSTFAALGLWRDSLRKKITGEPGQAEAEGP